MRLAAAWADSASLLVVHPEVLGRHDDGPTVDERGERGVEQEGVWGDQHPDPRSRIRGLQSHLDDPANAHVESDEDRALPPGC